MKFGRPFVRGLLASFLGLLALAEILLRGAAMTGLGYRLVDPSGTMSSWVELEDRIRAHAQRAGARPLWVLGDSVLGPGSLMERRLPGARSQSLDRHLASSAPDGRAVLSLGSDGLLLPDVEGLAALTAAHPSGEILLLLNFRMFAEGFREGPEALSRWFLRPGLSEETLQRIEPAVSPALEDRLRDSLQAGLCRGWMLFRATQALKALWHYPSREDLYQRLLEGVAGRPPMDDLREAALKQRVASYYQGKPWGPEDLPFRCLRAALENWKRQGVKVTLVLTPQNRKFLGRLSDEAWFDGNRKTLASFLKGPSGQGVAYHDWADRYPSEAFLDHCHLTPEGNERYARDLQVLLSQGGRP